MIAFIDAHRDDYGVEPICKVLPIAPSTSRAHAAQRRNPSLLSARARRDGALCEDIRRVFAENFSVYGARKVWRQLRREGEGARGKMSRAGWSGSCGAWACRAPWRGKGVKTTISDKKAPYPQDKVNRQFAAERPNALRSIKKT